MGTPSSRSAALLAALACACAPGGDSDPPREFNEAALPSLQATCESNDALTGDALLAFRQDHLEGTLSYVTAEGDTVSPTAVTVDVTWPDSPVAVCYPSYTGEGGLSAQPRLAIEGLTLKFQTADGKFDEAIPAKAWLLATGPNVSPALLGVSTRSQLGGSWTPFPEYAEAGNTLLFYLALNGGQGQAGGNVGLSNEEPVDLRAAVLRSRFAIALIQ